MRRATLAVFALMAVSAAGCANGRFYNPFRPASVHEQRIKATVHDPYPDQDKGHAVDDARPRDYQKQSPEPVRDRFGVDNPWGVGR